MPAERGAHHRRRPQNGRKDLEGAAHGGGHIKTVRSPQSAEIEVEKMINDFKTVPCGLEGSLSSHDQRCCPFYHGDRDRRRVVLSPSGPLYSAEPCSEQFDDNRQCSLGDSCGMCHSTTELLYHPDFFRKRLCHQAKRCPRGRFCAFAHARQELLVPHFGEMEEVMPSEDFIAHKFKTEWCPIGGPHDWENCVYAHTYRDWRRSPLLGYSSRPCPQWTQSISGGSPELMYADRCPRGMACPLAHGAKEQLYHPQFYKTSPCSANCKRGSLCAFTHGPEDTRKPAPDEAASRSVREAIPQALPILEQHQPTYWNPPRYHALEDLPRGVPRSAVSKLRDEWGHGSITSPIHEGGTQPSVLPSFKFDGPTSALMTDLPRTCFPCSADAWQNTWYPCQWMPCAESMTSLVQPPMGYSDSCDPWGLQLGCAPLVWGPHMHPCLMALSPSSHGSVEEASRVLEGLALEDGDENSGAGKCVLSDGKALTKAARKKFLLPEGLRTPSSLGSPPISATPTEVPSPRPAGGGSSSIEGSGDGSSDDGPREVDGNSRPRVSRRRRRPREMQALLATTPCKIFARAPR